MRFCRSIILATACAAAASTGPAAARSYLPNCYFRTVDQIAIDQNCEGVIGGFVEGWWKSQHWRSFDYSGQPNGPPQDSPAWYMAVLGFSEDSMPFDDWLVSGVRARNVADEMIRLGVPADHVSVIAVGRGHPLDQADMSSAANRRVIIIVLPQPKFKEPGAR